MPFYHQIPLKVSLPLSISATVDFLISDTTYGFFCNIFLSFGNKKGPGGKPCGVLHAMETPYVVRAHAASQLHKELPCWEFTHPLQKDGMNIKDAANHVDNERCVHAVFKIGKDNGAAYGPGYQKYSQSLDALTSSNKGDGESDNGNIIHGFLGTFHCVLYQSVAGTDSSVISIAPTTFSVGMFSWFPLFFPLREPQFVPPGSDVRCNMWRKCDDSRVWYEWCSEVISEEQIVSVSNLHNPNGRSSFVRL